MHHLYTLLLARKEAMERGLFTHPPSDWVEFQKRLGRWAELTDIISIIEGKEKQQENDDGKI